MRQFTRIVEPDLTDPSVQMYRNPAAMCYERPYGFYSEELRSKYIHASARIGGVGGGGATPAVMLAKEGVSDFSIADLDKVEESNVGRIPLFTHKHVGRYKVDVVADLIAENNPAATIRIYDKGVQRDTVDEFVGLETTDGETIILDEIDLYAPESARMLHQASRKYGRYVVSATDVERGGMVTTFDPRSTHTYERYMSARTDDTEEEFLRKVNGFQWPTIPNLPLNGSLDTFRAIGGEVPAPLPTTSRSVLVATNLALDEFEKILTLDDKRYESPHFYPEFHTSNPSYGEDFTTRHPRVRSVSRLARVAVRDMFGLNPPAGYSAADRERRAQRRSQH